MGRPLAGELRQIDRRLRAHSARFRRSRRFDHILEARELRHPVQRRGGGASKDKFLIKEREQQAQRGADCRGWDDGCEPDAVIASAAGGPELHGAPGGALVQLAPSDVAPPASDVVMVDLDDDGVLDAVLATEGGVVWLSR